MAKIYKFYLVLNKSFVESHYYVGLSQHFHIFDDEKDAYIVLWSWTKNKDIAQQYMDEHKGVFILKQTKDNFQDIKKANDAAIVKNTEIKTQIIDTCGQNLKSRDFKILMTDYEIDILYESIEQDFQETLMDAVSMGYKLFNDDLISVLDALGYTALHDLYYEYDDMIYERTVLPDMLILYLQYFEFLYP